MKKIVVYIFLFCCIGSQLSAQDIQVARWKNDAKAAYAIVIDGYATDYFDNIDTITSNLTDKGLTVSFATIANWSTCDMACRQNFYTLATNELLPAGNEFVNHSWDADTLNQDSINLQIDSSKTLIEKNINGSQCLFYAFPHGFQKEGGFMDTLRNKAFIGSRTNQEGSNINAYDFIDPFLLQSKFYSDAEGLSGLNQFIDDAILSSGFALRSCHNIGVGGIEPMSPGIWKDHLTFCKQKVDSNIIWMAGVQRIIKYAMERENFIVSSQVISDSLIHVFFDTETNEINPSPLIENTVYDETLTLLLSMPGEDTIKINADPWNDTLDVFLEEGVIVKIMQKNTQLYPDPYLDVLSDAFFVNCNAGGFSFSVNSNIAWNISSSGSWLHPSADNGYGPATVMVSYDANKAEETRIDSIIISGNQVDDVILSITQSPWQSIHESSLAGINVYPCPADDFIHVSCALHSPIQLSILDINGQVAYEQMLSSTQAMIDVSSLPAGVYLLRAIGQKTAVVRKIIIR